MVHVYIKKDLIEELFTNATVENIYFSDHDAVRYIIQKNAVDFLYCSIVSSMIRQERRMYSFF